MSERKPIPNRIRFEVFKRDHFRCIYCGRTPPEVVLEVDHIESVSTGGGNEISNLATSCDQCNSGKSNIPLTNTPEAHANRVQRERERISQIREMAKQTVEREELIQSEIEVITDLWIASNTRDHRSNLYGEPESSIRRFLQSLGIDEVVDAVRIASLNLSHKPFPSRFKYFCGVCWSKIRDIEDSSASKPKPVPGPGCPARLDPVPPQ